MVVAVALAVAVAVTMVGSSTSDGGDGDGGIGIWVLSRGESGTKLAGPQMGGVGHRRNTTVVWLARRFPER